MHRKKGRTEGKCPDPSGKVENCSKKRGGKNRKNKSLRRPQREIQSNLSSDRKPMGGMIKSPGQKEKQNTKRRGKKLREKRSFKGKKPTTDEKNTTDLTREKGKARPSQTISKRTGGFRKNGGTL